MHFQKQDMKGTHYTWDDEGRNHLFMGQPTRRPFDRFNGHQVLFLINFYASLWERFSIREGQAIEHQLSYYLPSDKRSEISVFNWLRDTLVVENNNPNNLA